MKKTRPPGEGRTASAAGRERALARGVRRGLRQECAERRNRGLLAILLDYDGTLVPVASRPEHAVPDREVMDLLRRLSVVGGIRVQLVSGRPRVCLDAWFGALPIALWAEHGSWYRPQGFERWQRTAPLPAEWLDTFLPIMERFVDALPGAHLEVKDASIVWHSREALDGPAAERARQLRSLIHEIASDVHVDVLEGRRTIEVRPHWMGKAIVVRHLLQAGIGPAQIVAFGDDPSDEELFRALPGESLTVAVGPHIARADYRLLDHRDVRDLLQHLIRGAWNA